MRASSSAAPPVVESLSRRRVVGFDQIVKRRKIGGVRCPGRRRYVGGGDVPRVQGGMGTAIVSTSSGVMTGHEAKAKGVGGEVVAYVW